VSNLVDPVCRLVNAWGKNAITVTQPRHHECFVEGYPQRYLHTTVKQSQNNKATAIKQMFIDKL
jgi:hypothetical protein